MISIVGKTRMYPTLAELEKNLTEAERKWAEEHPGEYRVLMMKKYNKEIA